MDKVAAQLFRRFNSIVVRLKEGIDVAHKVCKPSFNSIVVRLKASVREVSSRAGCRFNSIVVRLKAKGVLRQNLVIVVSIP